MPEAKPLALIIEDDPSSAEALALILKDWGAEVVQGADGSTVAQAISSRAAQLRWIITDYNLGPGPNGISLVRTVMQAAPQARVLVLSGSFHGKALQVATDAGFEVMQKPARVDAIVSWLERN